MDTHSKGYYASKNTKLVFLQIGSGLKSNLFVQHNFVGLIYSDYESSWELIVVK